jgi:hypothetical protein
MEPNGSKKGLSDLTFLSLQALTNYSHGLPKLSILTKKYDYFSRLRLSF